MALRREVGRKDGRTLSDDLVYEVLRRLDAVTLATASCASSGFRYLCEDEALWERMCISRWPSTKDPHVKSIVSSMGGFRKFYASCYPLIISKEAVAKEEEFGLTECETWWDLDDGVDEVPSDLSASHFISIVDVVYKGESVLSRTVLGIPGADDFLGWFSNCPFRVDLLKSPEEDDGDQQKLEGVTVMADLPSITSVGKERKDGKFWKALWDNLRVSWILINKKTKQMANLASWRPLVGQRHWPCDEDFLLRFGSILPAGKDTSLVAYQCNIVMKCRFSNTGVGDSVKTTLRLTELSMQLEDMEGTHLNGRDSLLTLSRALTCDKSKDHAEVLDSYHQYLKVQSVMKEERIQHEGRLDTAAVVSGIGAFLCLCYVIL